MSPCGDLKRGLLISHTKGTVTSKKNRHYAEAIEITQSRCLLQQLLDQSERLMCGRCGAFAALARKMPHGVGQTDVDGSCIDWFHHRADHDGDGDHPARPLIGLNTSHLAARLDSRAERERIT